MNKKMQEILDKIDGSAVFYIKIAPNLEIEDKNGIPYEVEGNSLIFIHNGEKISFPVPGNVLISEYPGGNERVGDAQELELRSADSSVSASIGYSYSKTQEYYQKLRQQKHTGRMGN